MIKVKVPPQIQIGGHSYKLIFDKMVDHFDKTATLSERTQEIMLAPNLSSSTLAISLYHEVQHFIAHVWVCEISELIIESLAQGWFQFLNVDLGIELDWSDIPHRETK